MNNFGNRCIDEKEKVFIYKDNGKFYLVKANSTVFFMDMNLSFSCYDLEKAKVFLKESDCESFYKILNSLNILRSGKYKDYNPDLKDAFFDSVLECLAAYSDKSGELRNKFDIEKFDSLKEKILNLNEEDKKTLFSIVNDINLIFNKICGE